MRVALRKTKVQMVVQSEPTKQQTFDEYAIRITATHLFVRPLRAVVGGKREVGFRWGSLYIRGLTDKIDAEKRAKKKARKGKRK